MTKEERREYSRQYRIDNAEKIRQYRIDNAEKAKEFDRQYYLDNKETIRERQRQYRIDNLEKEKERHCRYNKDNVEKRKEYSRQYYIDHADKKKEYNHQYCKDNAEIYRAASQRRRARKKQVESALTQVEWEKIVDDHFGRCHYCGVKTDKLHQEHKTPLSKGGGYAMDNIVPSCKSCNSSKGVADYKHFIKQSQQRLQLDLF